MGKFILKQKNNNKNKIIALYPGITVYLTYYSHEIGYGYIGTNYCKKIINKVRLIDKLYSALKSGKLNSKSRSMLRKRINKRHIKYYRIMQDMNLKIAKYLATNYDLILLPSFSFKCDYKVENEKSQEFLNKTHDDLFSVLLRRCENCRWIQHNKNMFKMWWN